MKLLGNLKKGLVFIISAPAGTGKTTLVDMLVREFPDQIVKGVTSTTRAPRQGEVTGVHYHFLTEKEFKQKIAEELLLEYVQLYGNYYGTESADIERVTAQGKHLILVIDTQGAMNLKKQAFPATFIFLQPPSSETLRERLVHRKTEEQHVIEQRLAWAEQELLMISEYDYCIINHQLEIAYQALRSIIIAEEHRTKFLRR